MGKIILNTLKGAGCGALAAIGLVILGACAEIFNIGYAILSCDCDREMLFEWSKVWILVVICIAGGAIIGLFYGIFKAKQEDNIKRKKKNTENKEIELKQRTRYAEELKQEAKKAYEICSRNRTNDKRLNSIKYKTSEQMAEIMNELTKVTEQQGRMNAMAEELRKDGRIQ